MGIKGKTAFFWNIDGYLEEFILVSTSASDIYYFQDHKIIHRLTENLLQDYPYRV